MNKSDGYYNTTNLTGQALIDARDNANTQEERILFYFEGSFKENFTPFDILNDVFKNQVPITSVRRAMTNLTSKGKLVKTDIQRIGGYGKLCCAWRLK